MSRCCSEAGKPFLFDIDRESPGISCTYLSDVPSSRALKWHRLEATLRCPTYLLLCATSTTFHYLLAKLLSPSLLVTSVESMIAATACEHSFMFDLRPSTLPGTPHAEDTWVRQLHRTSFLIGIDGIARPWTYLLPFPCLFALQEPFRPHSEILGRLMRSI